MSILIDENTRVVVQGITGHQAQFDTHYSLKYGTKVVAGVVPGREGQVILGLPIYNSVARAVSECGANASVLYIPAAGVKDAIIEAVYAGILFAVIITDKVPSRDFSEAFHIARSRGVRLIGPNCNGLISPGKSKMGILGNPGHYFMEGPVGVLSRSGGINHEIGSLLTRAGIGQSTVISVGGDPMIGTTFSEGLELFEKDDQTLAVVLFCEPGGCMEEDAADFICQGGFTKPVVAYVAGQFMENLPEGIPFGHAGAIIERGFGRPSSKKAVLAEAGVTVVDHLDQIPVVIAQLLSKDGSMTKKAL
ncbi:MAG: succinate--CoA ligase subunit alpha [Desulfobaccales bacterium]|jgi:succinyl-CoA synthetase alpha subunit